MCYFAKDEIYVAWDLREKKADQKSGFSVKGADLDLPLEAGIMPVKKAIEFYGWGEETVLAFRPEIVPEFLKKYCESAFQ